MSDASSSPAAPALTTRLGSIDAYRGFVMFLMIGEVFAFGRVAANLPQNAFWQFLDHHQSHVEWVGCVLHDLIQPSFSFLVGTAIAFSVASRVARGQTWGQMLRHALWRSLALTFLGVFLRSTGRSQTNFTFEDTLSQIGMGYTFLFLIGTRSVRFQWISLIVILVGYWLFFALHPLPGPGFDWSQTGTTADWAGNLQGFAAHWNKNTNAAWAFDRWFLNLFPREKPFLFNGGGYSTLSFIPTLGTMILGLIAGGWLRQPSSNTQRLQKLVVAGVAGLALGSLLNATGICPNVKRIWTPAWVLFSGGWCFLFMAAFYALVDVAQKRSWVFPLTVIGMNSIAAYCMDHLFGGFIRRALKTHLPDGIFNMLGTAYSPLVHGTLVFLVLWYILLWMHRQKIYLRL
jgi:predicted acyltransferase